MKLQYFGHLIQRANSLVKTLIPEKFEGKWRRGQQSMRHIDIIIDSMDMYLSKLWEIAEDSKLREIAICQQIAWHTADHGVINSQT